MSTQTILTNTMQERSTSRKVKGWISNYPHTKSSTIATLRSNLAAQRSRGKWKIHTLLIDLDIPNIKIIENVLDMV